MNCLITKILAFLSKDTYLEIGPGLDVLDLNQIKVTVKNLSYFLLSPPL